MAAQTRSSQEALMQWLSSDDEFNNENLERYVFASAYVTHPSEYLINDFLVSSAVLYTQGYVYSTFF